jgi:hypothetical protein
LHQKEAQGRARGRAIAFGFLRALRLICHPEERSDEGSAVVFGVFPAKRRSFGIIALPTFTVKQRRTTADPSLRLRMTSVVRNGNLKCNCPGARGVAVWLPDQEGPVQSVFDGGVGGFTGCGKMFMNLLQTELSLFQHFPSTVDVRGTTCPWADIYGSSTM